MNKNFPFKSVENFDLIFDVISELSPFLNNE
jgi:hypothetical protein